MATIEELLIDVDQSRIHIPEFQRPWVWKKKAVCALFESLYKRYPVGTVTFWPNHGSHGFVDSLIDGRQRLTAIYSVMRGQTPSWVADSPVELTDQLGFDVIEERFQYLTSNTEHQPQWLNVTDVFTSPDYVKHLNLDAIVNIAGNNLSATDILKRVFDLDKIRDIEIHKERLPTDLEPEQAVEVFKILNRAGTRVREADLVVARLSLVWPDARQAIEDAIESWDSHMYSVPPEAVLRCLAAIVSDSPDYGGLYGGSSIQRPEQTQLDDAFGELVACTNRILNRLRDKLGISLARKTVLNRGLVPLVYGAYLENLGRVPPNTIDRLLGWWQLSNLQNYWASDVLNRLRASIQALNADMSIDVLLKQLRRPGRKLTLVGEDFRAKKTNTNPQIRALLSMTKRCGSLNLCDGSSLSFDLIGANQELEAHHIFPRAVLLKRHRSVEDIDQVANFAFITKECNISISDDSPLDYLSEIRDNLPNGEAVLRSQWIPLDSRLWRPNAYDRFLSERRRLLAEQANEFLRSLLGNEAWETATSRGGAGS